jgi:hypothetical protein
MTKVDDCALSPSPGQRRQSPENVSEENGNLFCLLAIKKCFVPDARAAASDDNSLKWPLTFFLSREIGSCKLDSGTFHHQQKPTATAATFIVAVRSNTFANQ